MGFMDFLGNLGNAAFEKAERMKELRDEFRTYDDRLKYIYRHESGTRKRVVAAVLRERGYGRQKILARSEFGTGFFVIMAEKFSG